jgi:hypothetical protein
MTAPLDPSDVIVSKDAFDSEDPYDIIFSNISFLNSLFDQHIREDEVSHHALLSYSVDYYLAQVNNGGFSQFVYNSHWSDVTVTGVRKGLSVMGATEHLALFESSAKMLDGLGPEVLSDYFDSEYFGDNETRDALNAHDDRFFELSEAEDLIQLNATWLRGLSNLSILPIDDIDRVVASRIAEIPDMNERREAALADEPRVMKIVRALAAEAGQAFSHVTSGDPAHVHEGHQVLAWHFITDQGHHYMVDLGETAVMFVGDTETRVVEIDASEELFGDE